VLDHQFDLIIANQVFEYVLWPYKAARNVCQMLKPGGYFLMTTPFLIRVHAIPYDCTRWTETGIKYFLSECGFPLEEIKTGTWGNRACVKANFKRWARRGWFGSLKNEPNFPVSVWALAKKGVVRDR
jgi:SAM-dependent methyltransferase